MKIAVLSDIHGNLTAFNAVINDINKLDIDKWIIAGDHIVDCPQPNEVLEKIKNLNAYVIKGNREEYVLNYHKGMHNEWSNHKQMATSVWTHNAIDEDNIKYIDELPEQLSISLPKMDTIMVVHGSPFDMYEELFPDVYPERIEKALKSIKEGKNITMDFIKYAYKLAEKNGFINLKLVPNCIWDKAEEFWFEK